MSKYLIERVSRVVKEKALVLKGETVLIACSGGVDSMVLLHVMDELRKNLEFSIAAAHLDHCLRGSEGRMDQKLVAQFCLERGITFMGGEEDVSTVSQEEGLSIQDAARRVRYSFLRNSLLRIGGDKIATGHHSDDLVETLLMRLLRGTGLRGLRGIPILGEGFYIRPLLYEWKETIRSYAEAMKVSYREDPGNTRTEYSRNKVRNLLIPSLEEYNPSVKEAIFRLSTWAVEEGEVIDQVVAEIMKGIDVTFGENEVVVNREKLLECHPFLIKEIIRKGMIELGASYGPQGRNLELALDFIREVESGKRLDLSADIVIGRDFDEIFIKRNVCTEDISGENVLKVEVEAGWKGEYCSGERTWCVRIDIVNPNEIDDLKGGKFKQYFDVSDISSPLQLRNWRHGDMIVPFGLNGRKKVSDILVEEGVPGRKRDDILVLEDRHSLLWLIGVRRGGRGSVSRECEKVALIYVEPAGGREEA
jgi:tRNA(Ile)-lysidine synthase